MPTIIHEGIFLQIHKRVHNNIIYKWYLIVYLQAQKSQCDYLRWERKKRKIHMSARILWKFLRNKCANHEYDGWWRRNVGCGLHELPPPPTQLATSILRHVICQAMQKRSAFIASCVSVCFLLLHSIPVSLRLSLSLARVIISTSSNITP
jgi:hypothetical protein